jgi:hypothetical protein
MTFVFSSLFCTTAFYSAPTDYLYNSHYYWGGHMWPRSLQNRRWGRADAMRRLGGFLRFGGSSARILIGPSPWRLAHPTSHLHPPEYYHGQYSYESSEHDDDGRDGNIHVTHHVGVPSCPKACHITLSKNEKSGKVRQ